MDARQIIVEPVVSEKSYALMAEGKYTFRVNDRAHKTQIPTRSRRSSTSGSSPCAPRTSAPSRSAAACTTGKTRAWKKAIVELAPGDQIELFEGSTE